MFWLCFRTLYHVCMSMIGQDQELAKVFYVYTVKLECVHMHECTLRHNGLLEELAVVLQSPQSWRQTPQVCMHMKVLLFWKCMLSQTCVSVTVIESGCIYSLHQFSHIYTQIWNYSMQIAAIVHAAGNGQVNAMALSTATSPGRLSQTNVWLY